MHFSFILIVQWRKERLEVTTKVPSWTLNSSCQLLCAPAVHQTNAVDHNSPTVNPTTMKVIIRFCWNCFRTTIFRFRRPSFHTSASHHVMTVAGWQHIGWDMTDDHAAFGLFQQPQCEPLSLSRCFTLRRVWRLLIWSELCSNVHKGPLISAGRPPVAPSPKQFHISLLAPILWSS